MTVGVVDLRPDAFLDALDGALAYPVGAPLLHFSGKLREVCSMLLEVQPIGRLCKPQIGVDAGDDHARAIVSSSMPTRETRT